MLSTLTNAHSPTLTKKVTERTLYILPEVPPPKRHIVTKNGGMPHTLHPGDAHLVLGTDLGDWFVKIAQMNRMSAYVLAGALALLERYALTPHCLVCDTDDVCLLLSCLSLSSKLIEDAHCLIDDLSFCTGLGRMMLRRWELHVGTTLQYPFLNWRDIAPYVASASEHLSLIHI